MEWTNDLIFEFLNLYQNEPSLWNASSPEHKNKNDAFEAWIRIKTNLRDGCIPIKEIKKKKDNLMSTYRRQRSKVIDSMGGDQSVYKPEWPFYNVMATFLNDVYVPRKTKSYEDLLDTEDYEENTSLDDEKNQQLDQTDRDFSSVKKVPKKKIKRSKLREDDIKIHLEEAFNLSKQMNQNSDADESSLYCILLCKKLRGLKESTREIAMMEIDRVIYNLKHQESEVNKSNESHSMFNPQQPLQSLISLHSQPFPPHSLSTLLLSQLAPLLQQSSQPVSVHQQPYCPQSSPVDQKPSLIQSPGLSHSFHSP